MAEYKPWWLRVLIWLDQGLNVWFGWLLNWATGSTLFGHHDDTISAVLGRMRPDCRFCVWACNLLHKIDPNHCTKAIRSEQQHGERWDDVPTDTGRQLDD